MEGWWLENGIHWEISVSTSRHLQMTHNLGDTTLACEVTPSLCSVSAIGRQHVSSHCYRSQTVWNEMALSLKVLVESLSCLYWCCLCVWVVIHKYMCILLITSFQTLGSTPVWLPAPVAKHHGVLSWKSKVQDGAIIQCIFCTETKVVSYSFKLTCIFLSVCFSPSIQNQVQSLS